MSAGKEYTMCLRKAAIIRKTAITGDCFVELVELTVQALFFVGARINNMPPCHNAPKNSKSKPSTFTGNETSPLGVGYCAKYDWLLHQADRARR
jgi:hypothetical protein